jgi:hypothetical protein
VPSIQVERFVDANGLRTASEVLAKPVRWLVLANKKYMYASSQRLRRFSSDRKKNPSRSPRPFGSFRLPSS